MAKKPVKKKIVRLSDEAARKRVYSPKTNTMKPLPSDTSAVERMLLDAGPLKGDPSNPIDITKAAMWRDFDVARYAWFKSTDDFAPTHAEVFKSNPIKVVAALNKALSIATHVLSCYGRVTLLACPNYLKRKQVTTTGCDSDLDTAYQIQFLAAVDIPRMGSSSDRASSRLVAVTFTIARGTFNNVRVSMSVSEPDNAMLWEHKYNSFLPSVVGARPYFEASSSFQRRCGTDVGNNEAPTPMVSGAENSRACEAFAYVKLREPRRGALSTSTCYGFGQVALELMRVLDRVLFGELFVPLFHISNMQELVARIALQFPEKGFEKHDPDSYEKSLALLRSDIAEEMRDLAKSSIECYVDDMRTKLQTTALHGLPYVTVSAEVE